MKQSVKSKRSSNVCWKKLASKMYVGMVKEQGFFFSCLEDISLPFLTILLHGMKNDI